MASRSVEFHPDALVEAKAAVEWYRERSPRAAAAFLEELDHAIERIAEAPTRWASFRYGTRRFLLRRFPFSVVYRDVNDSVQVVAVAHARRKPFYWKAR